MKAYDYDCPVEATLEVIGGKWKATCLYYLIEGPKRFSELMELLETASSRILSKQLKELEEHEVIKRKIYSEVPPRVEYSLTDYGKTLLPLIEMICDWGERRLEKTGKKAIYNESH
ncbi:helix-turn-helix domain-containing protein [Fulvivirgaceae bacterium BMA10]|uniref:Helix-turn-helix domain-containing protein n=1 Tax=Splendidivirga corallicola TaxID=3051826 RepID=A0ABT8KU53_9BACT|nr:helix-turn-helix domain-containing protein [Fulvivirgaceae bacterium BMA10]